MLTRNLNFKKETNHTLTTMINKSKQIIGMHTVLEYWQLDT